MSSSSPNAKPKKLFVVGMHRSGTSILADLLKAHPSISGHEIAEMPPELENEGQHVQRVFPPDDALGGPGFFAFNPLAHLTEDAAQPEHAAQLEGEWGLHWQSDARCVLEKSPSSILRTRYLQALFPDAYFLVILRHPICTAYATHAWGLQHGGKNSLASDAVVGFVEHWLAAHEILQADLEHLRQVRVVHLEQLTESPQAVVDTICADLNLPTLTLPEGKVSKEVNRKYSKEWVREAEAVKARITAHSAAMAKFGYTLESLSDPTSPGKPKLLPNPLLQSVIGGSPRTASPDSDILMSSSTPEKPISPSANGNGKNGNGAAAKRASEVLVAANAAKVARITESGTKLTKALPSGGNVCRPLILTFGTRGDVQPFIPLATEMVSRGMQPIIVTLPIFQELIEGNGLSFAPLVKDDSAKPPRVDDSREEFFHEGVATFYEEHGDSMIERVKELVSSHKADCLVIGSLIFFLKWLRTLELPLIHTRFSPYAAKEGESSLQAHANDVVHFLSIARSFGLTQVIKEEAALPDQDLLGAIKDMKKELTLLAYSEACEGGTKANDASTHLPGLPMLRTGFWLTPSPEGYTAPNELSTFLNKGTAPICLNFGSMAVYDAPWAPDMLSALKASGKRIVAVGAEVPMAVRSWPDLLWLKSVPHASLFPSCCCVIHHGGAGTTAAASSAGVPSIVVPFLGWSDQPRFAAWVARAGGGVHLPPSERTLAGFTAALTAVLTPAAASAASTLGTTLATQKGAASAVDAIIAHVNQPPSGYSTEALKQLSALQSLPLTDGGKLRAGLYCLLHEPTALPLQTYEARDIWLKALGKQILEFPLYKPDWPAKHKPLDLTIHDLPHESSLIEWWYFHAHLTSPDGTPFCVFIALFQLKLGGETLSHVHASLLLNGKSHQYYTAGEPHAAETVIQHRHPKHDDYFERALLEVFKKKNLPAPDVVSPSRFSVPRDRMDYACDRVAMRKDEDGRYHVSVKPDASGTDLSAFGFDLCFTGIKPPVRNGIDGVSPGVSNDDAMFYYSITRMAVSGAVYHSSGTDGAAATAVPVEGEGWYDHEFGGDARRADGSGGIKVMDVAWCWTGVQLDDGSEVTYAKTVDNLGKGTLVDKAVMIDKIGTSSLHDAELIQTGKWTSLDTFIAYGNSWTLSVPSEGLQLTMTATCDAQELISVISTPAYWEGQVKVSGTRNGLPVKGNGFVEQYFGSQNQNFRTMLQAVSDVVLRNVDKVFPYNPTQEHMVQLVVSKEFEWALEGLPVDVFVDQLVKPVRAITDRAGKGWRSMGLLLASSVVGGESSKLERYTSFPEFLHTGSLIIDDIQDNSILRRGGPCAHITYGVATAINAGTAAYFLGEGITRDHPNLTDQQRLRVYELYFTCLRGAHVGQALDINGMNHMMESCLRTNDFDPMWKTLLCCHRLKSGLPASICARTGAVLGKATVEQEAALGDYFLSMGLAFQVIDDVINLQGFGKSLKTKAEDLIEGKITAPVIKCLVLMKDEPEKQQWLWKQYEVEQEKRDILGMVDMIEASGAFTECIKEAHGLVDEAWKAVDREVPDSFAKVCLRSFGWFVCKVRDY